MSQSLTFDAGLLARGWLAAYLATGNDEAVPALYRSVLVEVYDDGVRLTSSDRIMLLSAWVPVFKDGGYLQEEPPGIDVAPNHVSIARDVDLRAKALLGYLRRVAAKAAKDELPKPTVDLHVGVEAEDLGEEVAFPGMELEQVVLDFPGRERVALPTVNSNFPDYRKLLAEHRAKRTDKIVLGVENSVRVGQAAKILGQHVRYSFSGATGAISVDIGDVAPLVHGIVMPVRRGEEGAAA